MTTPPADTPSETDAARHRPWWRWPLRLVIALGVLIVVLALAIRLMATTGAGRGLVESRLETMSPAGQQIEIEGLEGDLFGRFRLESLRLSDGEGVWLQAEDLEMRWAPFALLSGHARVDLLSAERLEVRRRPQLSTGNDKASESGGLPFERLTLGELSIASIELSEGVAGPQARLALDASLRHGPDGGAFSAELEPESEAGDRLFADLFWGGPVPLAGSMELDGPAGGVFATLARLGPGQDLGISVEGAGNEEDWSADANVQIGGETAATLSATGEGLQGRGEGQLNLGPHPLTREYVQRLGERIDLAADVAPGETGARRVSVRIGAQTLDLRAAAPLEGGWPDRIEVSARSDQPMRLIASDLADVDWVSLDGAILRDDGATAFDGDFTAADLSYGDTSMRRVSGPLKAGFTPGETASLETRLTASDVRLPAGATPVDEAILSLDARYGLEDRMIRLAGARIDAPALQLRASGETGLDGGGEGLRGSLALDGPASGLSPVSVEGDWRLSGGPAAMQAVFAGSVSELPDPPQPFGQWVGERVDVDVSLLRRASGRLDAETLTLRAAGLRLGGDAARMADGALQFTLSGRAEPLGTETYSTGPVDLSLSGEGPVSALRVNLDASTPRLDISGEEIADLRLDMAGQIGEGRASGRVELGAAVEDAPARLTTDFAVDPENWSLDDTRLSWAGLTGRAEARAPLARPEALRGSMSVSGQLPDFVPAEQIDLDARFDAQAVRATGTVSALAAGPLNAIDLEFEIDGPPNALRYELEAGGGTMTLAGIRRDFGADVSGSLDGIADGQMRAEVSAEARLDDAVLRTAAPARFEMTPDGMVADIELSGFDGTAALRMQPEAGGQRLTGRLEAIRLASLLLIAGQAPLEGTLAGRLDMALNEETLSGGFELTASGVEAVDGEDAPLTLTASGEARGDLVVTRIDASDPSGLSLVAEADVPAAWVTGTARPPFEVQLRGEGRVDALASLVLPPETDFSGNIDMEVAAPVPFSPEGLDGRLDIRAARFEQGTLGFVLEQMEARAEISRGEIRLPSFSARDPEGGRLSGEGAYRFGGDNTLSLTADTLRIANRRTYGATASGSLRLDQTATGYAIAGDLTVDRADVNIEALPGAGLTTLDVRFPDGGDDAASEDTDEETRVTLDVAIRAPGRIFVSGQGLDAEMSLDAEIEGPLSEPRLYGTARIVRGRFDLAGKRFRFADSQIGFNGEAMAADLDIEARRETESLTAIVSISGTPRSPKIALGSQPELPEDEVLSRVLFGRSPAELSALETARLAAALAQLAGGGGVDLLGGLEDTLGLDQLDFGQDSSGASEVTTGKYIAENVYLEARTGPSGLPKLVLEWEPLENVEVEGDITPSESQEFSIRWTRDFD